MSNTAASAFTYRQLQQEQRPWVQHNFGERPAHQPLLGVIEELGELYEATDQKDQEDALADAVIFAADFSSAMGFDLEDVMLQASARVVERVGVGHGPVRLLQQLGRLAHAYLKREQGIRKNQDHDADAREALVEVMAHVVWTARQSSVNPLIAVVEETWARVRKRDWKADAHHAGESVIPETQPEAK